MTEETKDNSVEELDQRVSLTNKRIDVIADNVVDRLERLENKYWDTKKNSENRFWVSIWALAAGALVSIILISSIYNAAQDNRITEMVESGVNPIEAHCAFAGERESAMCTAIALTAKNSDLKLSK